MNGLSRRKCQVSPDAPTPHAAERVSRLRGLPSGLKSRQKCDADGRKNKIFAAGLLLIAA
jgi:hypothetical protein